jgi:hypothetical protein
MRATATTRMARSKVRGSHGNPAEFVKGSGRWPLTETRPPHRLSPPTVHLGRARALVTMGVPIDSRLMVHGAKAGLVF